MTHSISSLDVHQRVIESLLHAKITDLKELILAAKADLQKATKLSQKDVISAKVAAAKLVYAERGLTAYQLLNSGRTRKLATGCKAIDNLLQGGVVNHGITEVTGESGAGKTQLCLQLCLQVQLQQLAAEDDSLQPRACPGAVYISTENSFPIRRLQQMIECLVSEHPQYQKTKQAFGDRVYVQHIGDHEQLMRCLERDLPLLRLRADIGLVILDSVAALFRGGQYELQLGATVERSRDIGRLAAAMHRLAQDRNLHIVCVNQVTADIQGGCSRPVPALGLNWANFVTTRLQLFKREIGCNIVQRQLELAFAPHLAPGRCEFTIGSTGLTDVVSLSQT